jgi:steroid delta-isomerase-like uncharacterized protein
MSVKDHSQVTREIINAFNVANWTVLKNHLMPDAVYQELGTQRQIQGADQIIQVMQEWKKAMTDATGTVTNVLASGASITLEISWQGTHNGPFAGPQGLVRATGRRQTTAAAMILKFQGEKAKEIHHYFDLLTLLQQIGAMPEVARV